MTAIIMRSMQFFWSFIGITAIASAVAIALGGCVASAPPAAGDEPTVALSEPVARASLRIQADGQEFVGVASLKRQTSRKIRFEVPRDTYLFTLVNCAGEITVPHPAAGWYDFTFVPIMGLENMDSCILVATAITTRAETYRAIVDFADGHELPATVWCNRAKIQAVGAAACQSRASYTGAGLTQRVDIAVPTVAVGGRGCPAPRQSSWISTDYEIDIGPGFCVYKFMDQKKRLFRLTTYGYTTIKHVVPGGNK
jgi:hypothetical protein